MNVTIIADAIHPYEESPLSEHAAALSRGFKRAGHNITVVTLLPRTFDLKAYSLARRLSPIPFQVDGRTASCVRFDGRTADGVEVILLDAGDETPARAFPYAAAALLNGLPERPDAFLTLGPLSLTASNALRGAGQATETVGQIATLSEEDAHEDGVEAAVASSDRLVFCCHRSRDKWQRRVQGLELRIAAGDAVVVPLPAKAASAPQDKASSKARFQMTRGLPVRGDVPLVFAPGTSHEDLREIVSQDLQVVAQGERALFGDLPKQYSDRLALVDVSASAEALEAADAVIAHDMYWFRESLAHGALPIVDRALAADAVDIEPSLETGSAIVAGVRGQSLKAGIGRLLAACGNPEGWRKLSSRLPSRLTTWERVITCYVQLIEELNTGEKER